jgi:YegS/Rv2252/BmrU family lipid kinase
MPPLSRILPMGQPLSASPRALILFNPAAGQANLRVALAAAAEIWRQAGWQVELQPTEYAGHATVLAQQAAQNGVTIVVAAGGDGTVNEVVNGIVNTKTALAVLPIGTVNIWAREMGLTMDVRQSAQAFLTAQREQVDVGRAGERYFLLMAGVGFDAAVTAGVRSADKRRLGAIAYVKQAILMAWQFRGVRTHLRIDGKRIRGRVLMLVIGNSQLYGGVVKITAHAVLDDGQLDVCVIKGRRMLAAPWRLLSIFVRQYKLQGVWQDPQVEHYKARRVQITGKKKIPVQVDGDYIGTTPMSFEVVPQGLWVLVPKGADRSLWQAHWSSLP